MNDLLRSWTRALLSALPLLLIALTAEAQTRTYTLDADFDEGTLVNVNHDAPGTDQLQLDSQAQPFNFIWIAASARGTVIKINTNTGAILGEYRTAPSGQGLNPSRTTVDNNGNVWVTNRNASVFVNANQIAPGVPPVNRFMGSVVQIGLEENGQCIDRNSNGTIETSTGLADIRAWANGGGADTFGGVSTADDECIIHYVLVNARGTRHLSVDANNDVWVSGTVGAFFDLIDSATGTIVRQEPSVGFGGYGGLIDGNGVIWSARNLLRWDTANPLTGPNGDPAGASIGPPAAGTNWSGQGGDSYGLCIDSQGNVWNTQLSGNRINKYAPDGTFLGGFAHGNNEAQGCVVDGNDDVWVAHSLFSATTVGHLLNDGTYVGNVPLAGGVGPTGVAVDANGKVWSANINSSTASRIDPSLGPIGGGGVPIGAVDLSVNLGAGANPYNYSDMTGSTLIAPPNNGTWTVVYDSGVAGVEWGFVNWTSDEPSDSGLSVTAASSADGITFGPAEAVTQNTDLTVADGQFLRVSVSFTRAGTGETPVLFDLTITANRPPVCDAAAADPSEIWPPNHKFVSVNILGVIDPDGDPITITIDKITQDEPLDTFGDGSFEPDGDGLGTATALVRAERSGSKKVPGNGRVYEIAFTADDGQGGTCTGAVQTCVPHDQRPGHTCLDDGQLYNSVTGASPPKVAAAQSPVAMEVTVHPNPFNPTTTFTYVLTEAAYIRLIVYDVMGREVVRLVDRSADAGMHQAVFDASRLPSGLYLYRLQAGALVRAGTMLLVK